MQNGKESCIQFIQDTVVNTNGVVPSNRGIERSMDRWYAKYRNVNRNRGQLTHSFNLNEWENRPFALPKGRTTVTRSRNSGTHSKLDKSLAESYLEAAQSLSYEVQQAKQETSILQLKLNKT